MGQTAITETAEMKLFPLLNITIQLLELICYAVLYRHIREHHREMVVNNVITRDQCYTFQNSFAKTNLRFFRILVL
jgi:hypothetical protein